MTSLARRPLWLAIGWGLVATVTALSLAPSSGLPTVDYNDKVAHALAYFALMAWFGQIYGLRLRLILALLLMGATIEILQGWTGYRDMSAADGFANAIGVAAGGWLTRQAPNLLQRLDACL